MYCGQFDVNGEQIIDDHEEEAKRSAELQKRSEFILNMLLEQKKQGDAK